MGAKASRPNRTKRESKALISYDEVSNDHSSERSFIIEAIKPQCLKKRKMKKNQMKKLQTESSDKRVTKVKKLTLEDWLLSSPRPAGLKPDCLNENGKFYVFKHFSRRVHPSFSSSSRTEPAEDVQFQPTSFDQSFLMDLSFGDVSVSSLKKTQSGKLKKKVSFKLPEEGDIVIFHSPAETFVKEGMMNKPF